MNIETLQRFCAPKILRYDGSEFMEEPFIFGGYAYACNGHIAIKCAAIESITALTESQPILRRAKNLEDWIKVGAQNALANSAINLSACTLPEIKSSTCDHCNGTGEIQENIYIDCENCDGRGKINDEYCSDCDGQGEIKTDKTEPAECSHCTRGKNTPFQCVNLCLSQDENEGILFQLEYVRLLQEIGATIYLQHQKDKNFFECADACGVIMPVLRDERITPEMIVAVIKTGN